CSEVRTEYRFHSFREGGAGRGAGLHDCVLEYSPIHTEPAVVGPADAAAALLHAIVQDMPGGTNISESTGIATYLMANYVLEFERPILELEEKIAEMRSMSDQLDIGEEIEVLEQKVERLRTSIYEQLTRWQRVQLARHPDRPFTLDYIALICEDFI